MPGELEQQTRRDRLAAGIPLDQRTRGELVKVAAAIGISGSAVAFLEA